MILEMTSQQKEAMEKFKRLKVGALFMKMGTGKTRVALKLAEYNKVNLLVYVCPFSCIENIRAEFSKWDYSGEYKIIGYETLSMSDRKFLSLCQYMDSMNYGEEMIIADESIFIKNDLTIRFRRLCGLREKCDYALILNGTPITKNEWDLYNQMYFLSPKIIDMGREEFTNTFFRKITYKKKGHSEKSFYQFSNVNSSMLTKMINPYVFQCDLEFENKESKSIRWIQVSNSYDKYQEAKKKYLMKYKNDASSDSIIRMLQILNHISATDDNKITTIAGYSEGKRAIIYACYKDEINMLYKCLNGNCFMIDGDTKERDRIIKDFLIGNKPLIISYGCGSFSLNMQNCNEIIFSSLTFDYGRMEQAKARIKRIGQTKDINYTYLLTDCGINRMILENLSKKKNLDELVKSKLDKGDTEWLKTI
jgi:hypothetical protein